MGPLRSVTFRQSPAAAMWLVGWLVGGRAAPGDQEFRMAAERLTGNRAGELLVTDHAFEPADTGFLVELHLDGLVVVAEQAHELRRQRFALRGGRVFVSLARRNGGGSGCFPVPSWEPTASWCSFCVCPLSYPLLLCFKKSSCVSGPTRWFSFFFSCGACAFEEQARARVDSGGRCAGGWSVVPSGGRVEGWELQRWRGSKP